MYDTTSINDPSEFALESHFNSHGIVCRFNTLQTQAKEPLAILCFRQLMYHKPTENKRTSDYRCPSH